MLFVYGANRFDIIEFSYLYSQYTIHYTHLVESQSGGIQCNVRIKHQQIRNITNIGTEDMKMIHSPGFIFDKKYVLFTLIVLMFTRTVCE